jgi:sugar lactone lactonase YvrE
VWNAAERALYFSDVPRNAIYKWVEGKEFGLGDGTPTRRVAVTCSANF